MSMIYDYPDDAKAQQMADKREAMQTKCHFCGAAMYPGTKAYNIDHFRDDIWACTDCVNLEYIEEKYEF